MGGKHTVEQHHHHHTEYVQDPEILKQLEASRTQIQELHKIVAALQQDYKLALEQAKKEQDPANYEKYKEQAFKAFVNNLHKMKFTEKIPKKDGHRHFVVIGNIAVGKSSLLNYVFGLNLEVGLGETTGEVSQVAQSQDGSIHIWDCPGVNEHFSLFDPENLGYFHTADRVFILYSDSPKVIKEIILVLHKIKPRDTFLVRTKCDGYQVGHKKTVEEEIQTDRQLILKWGVDLPVLATSTQRDNNFMDNQRLRKLLNGAQ